MLSMKGSVDLALPRSRISYHQQGDEVDDVNEVFVFRKLAGPAHRTDHGHGSVLKRSQLALKEIGRFSININPIEILF